MRLDQSFKAWEAIEEREKVRTRSSSLLLDNLETERATRRELVKSHRVLANSISNVFPQMGLFLGLKNLQTIDSCMEEDLSEVQYCYQHPRSSRTTWAITSFLRWF